MNINIATLLRSLAAVTLAVTLSACDQADAPEPRSDSSGVIGAAESPGHTTESADFILRASAIDSNFLSADMARQYAIEPGPNRGLLNVVILRKVSGGENEAVSARVEARFQNLIGHSDQVELRRVQANERISYVGSFDTDADSVFRFTVEAQPEGSQATLTLEFEDSFSAAE